MNHNIIIRFSLCCFVSLLLFFQRAAAQSVAINTDGSIANANALLDIKSNSKGMLIPRMSKTQKNAIVAPATGLLVFQDAPDSIGFYYYGGSNWLWLTTSAQQDTAAWKSRGNAGTSTANNFIGTTDNVALSFRQNNKWLGRWNTTTSNYFIGDSTGIKTAGGNNIVFGGKALQENTSGSDNISIGANSMQKNTSGSRNTVFGAFALATQSFDAGSAYVTDNTAIGHSALFSNQPTSTSNGYKNVAIGNDALYANTTGYENTVVGVSAMRENISGRGNVAIGRSANRLASSGHYNSYIGYASGYADSVGSYNTGVGYSSLNNHVYDGDGYNTAVGASSLEQDSVGIGNTGVGVAALRLNKLGFYNTSMGLNAGYNTSRSRNTFVGAYSGFGDRTNGGSALADSGINNTGVGAFALFKIANGTSNTAVGYNALYSDSSGLNNTAVGRSVLVDVTTGSFNTAIGYFNDVSAGNLTNTTTVGARAYVTQDNSLILGSINGTNGATANTSVGIGTTAPTARLDVNADFKLGNNGSILNEIIKSTQTYNISSLAVGAVDIQTFTVAGAAVGSVVYISPQDVLLDGITISYARVSAANTVEVKFINAGTITQNPPSNTFYISVIR